MIKRLIEDLVLLDGVKVGLLLVVQIHEGFIHFVWYILGGDILKVRERAHTLHRSRTISFVSLA